MSHVIATYNMSFMSDLLTPLEKATFASEWSFLSQYENQTNSQNMENGPIPKKLRLNNSSDLEKRRRFWINSMNLLNTFIENNNPSAIGLQEMNLTEYKSGTGTDAINTMLTSINSSKNTNYTQLSKSVPTNNAGLSIIYDENKLGKSVKDSCLDNPNQGGRPLLLVLTQKGDDYYLLINIHGAQEARLRTNKEEFNKYMIKNNKETIETEAINFLGKTIPKNIFVMGDFNDRYDAIKDITIAGMEVSYNGTAPKSCCHNWDSACEDKDLESNLDFTCKEQPQIPKTSNTPNTPKTPKLPLPPGRGKIENYRYAGDKVFGLNPTKDIKIYNYEDRQGLVSKESDHELVFATFNDVPNPASGGRRKIKKSRKQRKTRRNKTMRH